VFNDNLPDVVAFQRKALEREITVVDNNPDTHDKSVLKQRLKLDLIFMMGVCLGVINHWLANEPNKSYYSAH